jgi:hypothetical protein
MEFNSGFKGLINELEMLEKEMSAAYFEKQYPTFPGQC